MSTVPQPIAQFSKDPTAVLDYAIDWSDFLGDDAIATSSWSLDAGVVSSGATFSRTIALIFISGGTAGSGYNATNHITTTAGRADSRTIKINVVNR